MRKEIIYCDICKEEKKEDEVKRVSYNWDRRFEVCEKCSKIIEKAEEEIREEHAKYIHKAEEIEAKYGLNIKGQPEVTEW